MAKKQTTAKYTPQQKTRRRGRAKGLNHRKTYGPKSNMRVG